MRLCETSPRRAFTLIELLVVIGIIAVLLGTLLPVISGVMERGRDLKCQSNLRSIIQAMHIYAAENDGAMPWGFVYHNMTSTFGGAASENNSRYITWATLVGKYMNKSSPGIGEFSGVSNAFLYPAALQCAEADQVHHHLVSYAINWVVSTSPPYECDSPPGQLGVLRRTTRVHQLLKETAVVWDTGILEEWLMQPWLRVGADIDGQRMMLGAIIPQYRFYTVKDIFAQFPPGIYGQNMPVQLNVGSKIFYNRDPGTIAAAGGTQYPYQGNLRFRHQKNTTCNVGFSDGSVRKFTAKMNRDQSVKSHDALRRYFMIKWPTGVVPHPGTPH